jgi:hypothetical protein
MSDESKKFALDVLRREFIKFMEAVSKIPGAPVQKQQAFLRFDEGHMWMQNAVFTYVEPQENAVPDAPPSDQPIIETLPADPNLPDLSNLSQEQVDNLSKYEQPSTPVCHE